MLFFHHCICIVFLKKINPLFTRFKLLQYPNIPYYSHQQQQQQHHHHQQQQQQLLNQHYQQQMNPNQLQQQQKPMYMSGSQQQQQQGGKVPYNTNKSFGKQPRGGHASSTNFINSNDPYAYAPQQQQNDTSKKPLATVGVAPGNSQPPVNSNNKANPRFNPNNR
jgi:hypothetical protein